MEDTKSRTARGKKKAITAGVLALIAVAGAVLYQKASMVHVDRGTIQYTALVLGDAHFRASFNKHDTARASCSRNGLPIDAPFGMHRACLTTRAIMIEKYPSLKFPYNERAAFDIDGRL